MSRLLRRRIGLRRQVLILLPVAAFLLILLGAFTLWSYRSAVHRLVQDRRQEASVRAQAVSAALVEVPVVTAATLRGLAPGAELVALLDLDGRPVATAGSLGGDNALSPLSGSQPKEVVALGPGGPLPDRVAAFLPLEVMGRTRMLRLDLSATELDRQLENLRILTWVTPPLSLALIALLLIFLRHFLVPYETLLEKARQSTDDAGAQDEAAFLISTVERALARMTRVEEPSPDDDIAALQRTLGPSLQSGLILIDLDGMVLALNDVGADLLQLERQPDATSYQRILEAYPPLVEVFDSVLSGDRSVRQLEIEIEAPTGTRTLGLTAHPLRRDDGSVRGYLTLFVDLTQVLRRADEEKLTHSLTQLGELASGIAHELRNSLATLRGYLTLIQRQPAQNTVNDYLQEIHRESEHLERVLEDFLSFARPGTKRADEVQLLALLSRAAQDPTLEGMPVEVRSTEKGEVPIKGDEQLLERAVRNLLHNAARAEWEADRKGPLTVEVSQRDGTVRIEVGDRGPGVVPEMRDRLFQPFATSRAQGVGLGLALAHRIVSLHGGRLSLENRSGGGTLAVLQFPLEPADGEASESLPKDSGTGPHPQGPDVLE